MGQLITNWVTGGGIAAVLILMAVESCGIPFPSEVIMPVAGYFAATGRLNLVAVIIAGTVGNLIGSLAAYWLARRFGRPLLLGPGRRVGISPRHLDLADHWFERYGLPAVFFGRLLPVIRTYISFPAGLARIQPVWFAVLTFAGALPWCIALAEVGYQIGANYDRVAGPIGKAAIVIAVLVVLGLVAWYIRGRRARRSGTTQSA
ncbi:MAG TPA: DedA family protein [Candidatus Acidoferrales bacterium]|nr:DedA family protein [Candidatus Acidoferrales bacterium]